MNLILWSEGWRVPIIGLYVLYVLWTGFRSSRVEFDNRKRVSFDFVLISIVVLGLLRLPTIFIDAPFNPDEAQYLAAAIKFKQNMNTWLAVDLMTSGPLNAYPLMWPFLFGLPASFAAAHLSALAFLALTWIFLLSALRSTPADLRVYLAGATIVLLGGVTLPDYLEFTSELTPCCLLMFAASVVFAAVDNRASFVRVLLAGAALGLVPFAKLQAVPIALTIGTILLVVTVRTQRRPWLSATALAAAGALPSALILTPLLAAGGFSDFWMSYIQGGASYTSGGWGKMESSGLTPRLKVLNFIIRADPALKYDVLLLAGICVIALWLFLRAGRPSRGLLKARLRVAIAALILAASVAAAVIPVRPFPHYAYFVVWPATLFTGFVWALARSTDGALGARGSRVLGVVLAAVVATAAVAEDRSALKAIRVLTDPVGPFDRAGSPPGDPERALVWGWMSELYVWFGWTPATRDQHTYAQIWPTPMRDYFRARMMAELRSDPPDYVVDAVASGSFGFTDSKLEGIASFADLAEFVAKSYTLVSRAAWGDSCPRFYARRDAVAEIGKTYVPAVSALQPLAPAASETAEAAREGVDFLTCVDFSHRPDDRPAAVELDLGRKIEIASVELLDIPLAFRPLGPGARAEKLTGVLRAYSDQAVTAEQDFTAEAFPRWAVVEMPRPMVADRIVIAAKSAPPGLTLIRVRRPPDAAGAVGKDLRGRSLLSLPSGRPAIF